MEQWNRLIVPKWLPKLPVKPNDRDWHCDGKLLKIDFSTKYRRSESKILVSDLKEIDERKVNQRLWIDTERNIIYG